VRPWNLAAVLVVICAVCGGAPAAAGDSIVAARPCWETVTPLNASGFDFEISSTVEGPTPGGVYTYTYTLYRIDSGLTKYKGVSHVSIWFPCGLDAERSILGGASGITMTCREGGCPAVEPGNSNGMAEPILDPGCQQFWGFKLDQCGAQGGYFLLPHVDQVSYPFDWMDPFCTITFLGSTPPQMGKWMVKGGELDGEDGKLYDAGSVWVPSCLGTAVSAGDATWGAIKALYR
jgi:hypothetical protein